jgi:poly-gamma-glutamate synthesis protein (capsule biosynthesis protein)
MNGKTKYLLVLTILCIACMSVTFLPFQPAEKQNPAPADSLVSIRLSFVGDLMCHSPQYQYARTPSGGFDFAPAFAEVRALLKNADITFGNLETVISDNPKYSGYPYFNAPAAYLKALHDAGFRFLFTANNHCLDQGQSGLLQTLEKIRRFGFGSTGTFSSAIDHDSVRVISVKDIRIALLAYTFGTNDNPIPSKRPYLVNLIDTARIREDIARAQRLRPDILLTYLHFGTEYEREPNEKQKALVEFLKTAGVDLIIASHPHVLQPVTAFKTMNPHFSEGLVAYSLGNFISNQQWRYSDAGVILSLTIEKRFPSGKVNLVATEAVPTWVFRGKVSGKKQFIVLPSADTTRFPFLSPEEKVKMLQSFVDSKAILLKYAAPITIH